MTSGLLVATLRNHIRRLPLLNPSPCSTIVNCGSLITPARRKATSLARLRTVSAENPHFQNVRRCLSAKSGKKTVKVQFIDRDGDSFIVDAQIGKF